MICLLAGAVALSVSQGFTLSWTHSVEKTEWREDWSVVGGALHLDRASVKGSGAGMEPGDGAILQDGRWIWAPDLTVPSLTLAASGATVGGWQLCTDAGCRPLGEAPGAPITLRPCP